MFEDLDPLLHSQLRLAIISILVSVEKADFVFLKEKTRASSGNLSVQIEKLNKAKYIEVRKHFEGKRPRTICKITNTGIKAFENYVNILKEYIEPT